MLVQRRQRRANRLFVRMSCLGDDVSRIYLAGTVPIFYTLCSIFPAIYGCATIPERFYS
jgi:hypothetical protein